MDIQEKLTAFANLGATWVMWLLIGLSIIAVAIILERAYYFFSSRDNQAKLQGDLRDILEKGSIEDAQKRLKESPSHEAHIISSAMNLASQGSAAVEERLQSETKLARARMERYLAYLGTVGNNAPFVGLLGTVIGIIRAFQELNESQGQVSSGLMAEIGEALVATAIGLLVALPAVAAFNYFQRLIKGRLVWANALSHDLMAHLKSEKK